MILRVALFLSLFLSFSVYPQSPPPSDARKLLQLRRMVGEEKFKILFDQVLKTKGIDASKVSKLEREEFLEKLSAGEEIKPTSRQMDYSDVPEEIMQYHTEQEGPEARKDLDAQLAEMQKMVTDFNLKETEKNKPLAPKSQLKESMFSSVFDGITKKYISDMIKENPFSAMDSEQIRSTILRMSKGSVVGPYLENNPKWILGITAWIKSKTAIPSLFGILNKPKQLKIYTAALIGIIIFLFLMNMRNTNGGFVRRVFNKLRIILFAVFLNLGIFFFLFRENIMPSIRIFTEFIL